MWFGYELENSWHPVTSARVKEIVTLNQRNILPETLESNEGINGKDYFISKNKERSEEHTSELQSH